jgi:hypothetical protein
MGAFHRAPPEQKRLSTADWDDRGWPVHLSELEDDGVAEEAKLRKGAIGDGGREGRGT